MVAKTITETERNFNNEIWKIITSRDDVRMSKRFSSDFTGSFSSHLCVCWAQKKAWLELEEDMFVHEDDDFQKDLDFYRSEFAEFGVQECDDVKDFNRILREIGGNAYERAHINNKNSSRLYEY